MVEKLETEEELLEQVFNLWFEMTDTQQDLVVRRLYTPEQIKERLESNHNG